ncbi:uncharacterized protein CLUP02_09536 [Colletotrichum lupini]|uniref:Uncharacterized protein n=1 Tax=Colletotrichum lupini TaxID=145971 RepID=A0A9Q8SVU5_9PEZI|nr:uncharacterized protein CLUP02_09536 [Colletotrichum lupini]UQC84040.1 hypothetical protein CLUP02_09536 [Colletotrichum lupini]
MRIDRSPNLGMIASFPQPPMWNLGLFASLFFAEVIKSSPVWNLAYIYGYLEGVTHAEAENSAFATSCVAVWNLTVYLLGNQSPDCIIHSRRLRPRIAFPFAASPVPVATKLNRI